MWQLPARGARIDTGEDTGDIGAQVRIGADRLLEGSKDLQQPAAFFAGVAAAPDAHAQEFDPGGQVSQEGGRGVLRPVSMSNLTRLHLSTSIVQMALLTLVRHSVTQESRVFAECRLNS